MVVIRLARGGAKKNVLFTVLLLQTSVTAVMVASWRSWAISTLLPLVMRSA